MVVDAIKWASLPEPDLLSNSLYPRGFSGTAVQWIPGCRLAPDRKTSHDCFVC